ncbi:MAG: hypothetical protein VYA54_06870 [Bdellovibrionota bacterium]|nr:hypothetical protein [Bdellovibrionota bacterium]
MKDLNKSLNLKLIIKKCYVCGELSETATEPEKCGSCGKSFLPLNYFQKVHDHTEFKHLYCDTADLHEDDLIKGIYVIW